MPRIEELINNNRDWARRVKENDPKFFERLSGLQTPHFLWIGCSDSRVPANDICGLVPGDVFVHRNVANVVVHSDLNCLSVLQFAIDILRIEEVIVCGHYGCGGVLAALKDEKLGLVDNWLRHVQDVRWKYSSEFEKLKTVKEQHDKLCELNVVEQVKNLCDTTIVREAWRRGQSLIVHGWIYGLNDGLLKDLGVSRSGL